VVCEIILKKTNNIQCEIDCCDKVKNKENGRKEEDFEKRRECEVNCPYGEEEDREKVFRPEIPEIVLNDETEQREKPRKSRMTHWRANREDSNGN
jgi:hypothetical protein